MNLQSYFFDVEERDVILPSISCPGVKDKPIDDYKAIVSTISGKEKVVSITKKSYKLIRNEELIEPFLEQLTSMNERWEIDTSHSFCMANRMRLQVTFPEIKLHDGTSEIPLSLYLHNSYDQSEGVRLFWGAIRAVCSNGMIFGKVMGSLYARHTSGFTFDKLEDQFNNMGYKIEQVQALINYLKSTGLDESFMKDLQESLGKRRLEEIIQTDRVPDQSQWNILNDITYHISHDVPKPKRADLQLNVSKVFQL
tara:strand:- start:30322 stop:31080 length:759 start_codon:yes stop_codon:yes gene_type:complete